MVTAGRRPWSEGAELLRLSSLRSAMCSISLFGGRMARPMHRTRPDLMLSITSISLHTQPNRREVVHNSALHSFLKDGDCFVQYCQLSVTEEARIGRVCACGAVVRHGRSVRSNVG